MENNFLDKVEDNAMVRIWSEKLQLEKGDSLAKNYVSELWDYTLGIWGAVGYAPLLVLRQYNSRQFVPATYGLAQCEFSYQGDNYKKKVKEISQAWNQVHRMKRLAVGSMTTPGYGEWQSKRINDNIPELNLEGV
ncbi:hypothetical protein Gotur_030567 [Gossypium turneri]